MNDHGIRRLEPGRVAIWVGAVIFFGLYLWLDLNKLHALRVGSNTGSYLQGALNFIHHGTTFDWGDWKPELAQHDQWLMLVLTPFAALWPRPETVMVVQVAAIAFAAPVLYAAGRRFGAGDVPAAVVAFAYLVSPSIQGFAYSEFVPVDFVPILTFALAIAVKARSLIWSLVFAQLLTGTKEDVTLFVFWFALAGALWYDRAIGWSVATLCALNFGLYEIAERLTGVATIHPAYGTSDPEWPKQGAFFLEILAPFAFAPLTLGWRVLLAAPLMAELMLAQHWPMPLFQAGVYYTIPLVTLVSLGAAYAVARMPGFARAIPATAAIMALFFNVTVLHTGRHPFSQDPQYATARAWGLTDRPVQFPCEDQGAWVVAAGDTNAQLLGCTGSGNLRRARPAWHDEPLASDAKWTDGPDAR